MNSEQINYVANLLKAGIAHACEVIGKDHEAFKSFDLPSLHAAAWSEDVDLWPLRRYVLCLPEDADFRNYVHTAAVAVVMGSNAAVQQHAGAVTAPAHTTTTRRRAP